MHAMACDAGADGRAYRLIAPADIADIGDAFRLRHFIALISLAAGDDGRGDRFSARHGDAGSAIYRAAGSPPRAFHFANTVPQMLNARRSPSITRQCKHFQPASRWQISSKRRHVRPTRLLGFTATIFEPLQRFDLLRMQPLDLRRLAMAQDRAISGGNTLPLNAGRGPRAWLDAVADQASRRATVSPPVSACRPAAILLDVSPAEDADDYICTDGHRGHHRPGYQNFDAACASIG
jgi:hypothetical protein